MVTPVMVRDHEQATAVVYEGENGGLFASSEERVGFWENECIKVTQVKCITGSAIGNGTCVGHQAIAACFLEGDAPCANSTCPIRLHLWIRIFLEWIRLAGTDYPVGIARRLRMCVVEQDFVGGGCGVIHVGRMCRMDRLLGEGEQCAYYEDDKSDSE